MIKKAIIPAAGLGTRFLPITKAVSKEMLPIVNKPIIQFAVEECIESGIEEVMIVIHKNKSDIINYFDINNDEISDILSNIKITFVYQNERKGLGHAIYLPLKCNLINQNEDFAVLLPDELMISSEPVIKQLINFHKYNTVSLALREVSKDDIHKYGIVGFKDSIMNCIIEKPNINEAPSSFACMGRYILPYNIIDFLENASETINNEIQLTDSINILLKQNKNHFACQFIGKRFDTGQPKGYMDAQMYFYKDEIL